MVVIYKKNIIRKAAKRFSDCVSVPIKTALMCDPFGSQRWQTVAAATFTVAGNITCSRNNKGSWFDTLARGGKATRAAGACEVAGQIVTRHVFSDARRSEVLLGHAEPAARGAGHCQEHRALPALT